MIPRHIHSILGIGRRFLGMVKFLSGSLKLLGRNFQFQGWRTAILVGTEFLGGTVIDPRNGNNDHVCSRPAVLPHRESFPWEDTIKCALHAYPASGPRRQCAVAYHQLHGWFPQFSHSYPCIFLAGSHITGSESRNLSLFFLCV